MKTKQVCYIIGFLWAMALGSQAQTPPTVTTQPTNQSVSLGANVTFTVTATGTPPLSYQWRHEETNIELATTRTLTVANVQVIHQDRYDVVVANSSGSVTSRVATLTVDTTFTKITSGSIVNGPGGGSVAWGDYDNDGDPDLFSTSGWHSKGLYRNEGQGRFTDVSAEPFTSDSAYGVVISEACAWGDYDNDGFLDLFVGNRDNHSNFLYHNNGDGSFTKITTGSLVSDVNDTIACGWADYDNDGFLDLFVANLAGPPNLFLPQQRKRQQLA